MIHNTQDVIDSRDVAEAAQDILDDPPEQVFDEHHAIVDLDEEGHDVFGSEWLYGGVTLIRYDYFTEYAKELAADLGMLNTKHSTRWPYMHIDWREAAEDLKGDYAEVVFDGVVYYGRI